MNSALKYLAAFASGAGYQIGTVLMQGKAPSQADLFIAIGTGLLACGFFRASSPKGGDQ